MTQNGSRIEIRLDGLSCVNCAHAVESKLRDFGLPDAAVNFAASEASLTLNDSSLIPGILATIESLGYGAKLVDAEDEALSPSLLTVERLFAICAPLSILLMLPMFFPIHFLHRGDVQLVICLPVFLIGLHYFGRSALSSLRNGIPNMDVLIVTGIIASFAYSLAGILLGRPELLFFETTATITAIVLLGNILEHRAVKKTTSAIEELAHLQPKRAKLLETTAGGEESVREVPVRDVRVGDFILLNTGDHVPADGEVTWGSGALNEAMISGESLPVDKSVGDRVIGGTVLEMGNLKIRTTAVGEHSVLAGIIRLVKDAQNTKPEIQKLGDLVSSQFVPAVLVVSLLTIGISYGFLGISFQESLLRSIAVLVIACPCAMGLATPTAVMVGLGKAAKRGILIKGADTAETFASVRSIIFDKTGTLTTGKFSIERMEFRDKDTAYVKAAIAGLERYSSHPIARSLTAHLEVDRTVEFREVRETKGVGITGRDRNGDIFEITGADSACPGELTSGGNIAVFKNGDLTAKITIKDTLKPEAYSVMRDIRAMGIRSVLLSGDTEAECRRIAEELGMDEIYWQKKPEEKLEIVRELSRKHVTAFVGDGINDAPSLSGAAVGVSLSDATEAAIQSAQVILLHGGLDRLVTAIHISKLTYTTIRQNLFWAFFYNVISIPLAASGYLTPMVAAFAMAMSDVVVIANSLRLRARKI